VYTYLLGRDCALSLLSLTRIYTCPTSTSESPSLRISSLGQPLQSRLLLPLPCIINRLIPIIKLHINTLRYRNAARTHRTPSPKPHQLHILLETKEKRQRHRNNIVHKEIAPAADILFTQSAEQGVYECGCGIRELESSEEGQYGGNYADDFRVAGEGFGKDVSTGG